KRPAAFVPEAGAGPREGPDPQALRAPEQEDGVGGTKPLHGGAVVEPAGEVPPFPPAQGLGGVVELAGGVGHVVVLQRRDRGGDAGAGRLPQRVLLADLRPPPLPLGPPPFPRHPPPAPPPPHPPPAHADR